LFRLLQHLFFRFPCFCKVIRSERFPFRFVSTFGKRQRSQRLAAFWTLRESVQRRVSAPNVPSAACANRNAGRLPSSASRACGVGTCACCIDNRVDARAAFGRLAPPRSGA